MAKPRRARRHRGKRESAPVWMGALFVLAGCGIMGVGGGLIPVDPESVHAPGWVLVLVGVVFALAGVIASLPGGSDEPVTAGLVLVMMVCFASVFSWVAFGPGERQFTGGASVGGVGVGGRVGSLSGRIAFGFGSVLMWAIALAVGARFLKKLRG